MAGKVETLLGLIRNGKITPDDIDKSDDYAGKVKTFIEAISSGTATLKSVTQNNTRADDVKFERYSEDTKHHITLGKADVLAGLIKDGKITLSDIMESDDYAAEVRAALKNKLERCTETS